MNLLLRTIFSLTLFLIFTLTSQPVYAQSVCDPNAVISLISRNPDGTPDRGLVTSPRPMSTDGRYVILHAVNVFDRQTCQTYNAAVNSEGEMANHPQDSPNAWAYISGNGRYVVFQSNATNLIPNDTNTCFTDPEPGSCMDVFVHDMQTGETRRVSVSSSNTQANDGQRVPKFQQRGVISPFPHRHPIS